MKKIILTAILSSGVTFVAICYFFMTSSVWTFGEAIEFRSTQGDFYFEAVPSKGGDYEALESSFLDYKINYGLSKDAKIYRVTRKNYLRINMWCDYKFMKEWNYPLKNTF